MRVSLIGVLLLSVSLIGCLDEFERASDVTRFRVLALSAEPPEIAPGEGTSLEVLFADPRGDGRDVWFAWIVCREPVYTGAGLSACEPHLPVQIATAEQGGDSLVVAETPPNVLDYAPNDQDWIRTTVFLLTCAGGEFLNIEQMVPFDGLDDPEELCNGGESLTVYKHIVVSESDTPNHNPEIESLEVNGLKVQFQDTAVLKCREDEECGLDVELAAYLGSGSIETYEIEEFGETKTVDESLYVSWFVTNGGLDMDRSSAEQAVGPYENTWKPEKPGRYTMWVVVHDTRGGTGWQTIQFDVQPI